MAEHIAIAVLRPFPEPSELGVVLDLCQEVRVAAVGVGVPTNPSGLL